AVPRGSPLKGARRASIRDGPGPMRVDRFPRRRPPMACPKLAASVAALTLLPCLAAAQEVHHVPKDHVTIQAAVEAAASGDTILVSGGTYEEAVVITGKDDLVVKAKGKVVIDPPGDA